MLARLSTQLSVFLFGLLAGALLFIAFAIIPFWEGLAPTEFRSWFAANPFRVGSLMLPLEGAAILAALTAWIANRGSTQRSWLAIAALAALGVGLVGVVISDPANRLFPGAHALSDADTTTLLQHWVRWHWVRLGLAVCGFVAALRAVAGAAASWA